MIADFSLDFPSLSTCWTCIRSWITQKGLRISYTSECMEGGAYGSAVYECKVFQDCPPFVTFHESTIRRRCVSSTGLRYSAKENYQTIVQAPMAQSKNHFSRVTFL